MTRKYSNDIRAEIDTLIADNTSGAITPAGVRQILNDIVDSFTPAYGAISRAAQVAMNVTTTPTKIVVFDTIIRSTVEIVASAAADTLTVSRAGSYNFSYTFSAEGPNNLDIVVALYRNGTATVWRALATGAGTNNRVEITVNGIASASADGDTFDLYAYCLSGSGNVNFSDAVFLMETIQTNGS